MSNILKNTKDVVKKMEEIINEKGPAKDRTGKPNAIQSLLAKTKLGKHD